MSKKIKTFAIIVLIIAILIFAASFFSGNKSTTSSNNKTNPLTSTTGNIPLPGISNSTNSDDEFSKVLASIKSIYIDTSIFQNRAYMLLRDFPVSLGTDVVGRNNPFAPIGVDSPVVNQDVTVQTLQAGKITKSTAEAGAQITLTTTAPVNVVFEYGTSDIFGSVTNSILVTKNTVVLSTISDLSPETTYYVRAIAVVGSNTITSNTTSFVTSK